MLDIHNYKKRLERTLENIQKSNEILDENRKIIIRFHDSCFSEGLSVCKIERYLYDLFRLAKMMDKSFSEANKEDLQKVMAVIEKKEWSPNSKQTFKIMMKKFYKWFEGNGEEYPEKIKWLKATLKNNHKKLPDELLTEEEIEKLIRACQSQRDKALFATLAESGCRIGEIANLKIKDVFFDEYGGKISVTGKTGARIVRLVNSSPYLHEWINNHPYNNNRENYLWINLKGKPVTYTRIASILKNSSRRAGINKRVHPHLLRHSRATYLAGYLTEAQMKDYLGWVQASKMAGIYVHMNGRDTDKAVLKLNGIKVDEERKEQKLQPKHCLRCKTMNEVTNRFCKICGFVLDQEEANKIIENDLKRNQADELMNKLVNDPEVLDLIRKKLSI